ncbi:MAG TPA: hypothetical protein VIK41_08785 [Gemmatimonadaceae bacterium]
MASRLTGRPSDGLPILLAPHAARDIRDRVEPLERDLASALVAPAECLRRTVKAAKRFMDVPEQPALTTREEKVCSRSYVSVPASAMWKRQSVSSPVAASSLAPSASSNCAI